MPLSVDAGRRQASFYLLAASIVALLFTDFFFRNRDGTIALIVHNTTDQPRPVSVGAGNRSAAYTLPPGALATFVWR